jgi:hypothetical protein
MSKKKKAPKASDLLKKALGKVSSMGGAFNAPVSPIPDARLNPSPSVSYELPPSPAPAPQTGKKERRKKTKGILFRMTPELYVELARCAYTDGESKSITRILTRGAMMEIQRIRAKYPNGLETRPLDELSDSEKEFLG